MPPTPTRFPSVACLSRSRSFWPRLGQTLFLTLLLGGTSSLRLAAQTPNLPDLPRLDLKDVAAAARPAIQEAYDAAQAHPLDAEANGKLGMILHAHNLFEEAEICYQRAHLLDPKSFRWAYYRGLIQLGRANCDEAVPAFRDALRLQPDYYPAQIRLGQCLRVSADMEEAGTLYESVVSKHPASAHAYYGLGRVYASRSDFNRAAEFFSKACEIAPNFGPAHYALAQAYQRLGKRELAEKERELYKKNESTFPQLEDPVLDEVRALYRDFGDYLLTAELFGGKGRLDEAIAAYEGALEINPQLPEAHARLIYLYGRLGQMAKAEEHYQTAIRIGPNTAEAYFNYGSLVLNQGDTQKAQELFQKAVAINPRYGEAQNSLGYLLEGQGKVQEAIAMFRQALQNSPGFPQAHFNLGRILAKQENYEEGIPHLIQALSTNEEDSKASYLQALGIAYASLGDVENARRYLRLARQTAAAHSQMQLAGSIDDDLKLLGGGAGLP